MIPDPPPNTIARPYRGLSVQRAEIPLTHSAVQDWLVGREVYRRTEWLVLHTDDAACLIQVVKESEEPLFSPVRAARMLAGPGETVWIESPRTDPGNATALARAAEAHPRPGARAYVVVGRYQHINFIWEPSLLPVRVTEVVPPEPPKLLTMAEQVVAFDDELPPIDLRLDAVDVHALAAANPADRYLLPCRGSGTELGGKVDFLDTRPATREDWLLIGCERSLQFHRHFYGDEPPRVDLCPRRRDPAPAGLTLTKCCLRERGIEVDPTTAVVPWGSNLDEVRDALRALVGLGSPAPVRVERPR